MPSSKEPAFSSPQALASLRPDSVTRFVGGLILPSLSAKPDWISKDDTGKANTATVMLSKAMAWLIFIDVAPFVRQPFDRKVQKWTKRAGVGLWAALLKPAIRKTYNLF